MGTPQNSHFHLPNSPQISLHEFNSISSSFIPLAAMKTVSDPSLSSHPLFCTIVALYSLLLLYLPHLFLRIVLSPVLFITGTLLLALLRAGAAPTNEIKSDENRAQTEECDPDTEPEGEVGSEATDPRFEESFVEWNVRAPLEVIYEEYEGEDDEDLKPNKDKEAERNPSLSLYYPDSDSDSSSDGGWDLPENICFRWEEEDREGLIEIALDGNKNVNVRDFQVEEENLIEIDISPSRIDHFPDEKW